VNAGQPLLEVEDLSVEFRTRKGVVKVLDRVSFRVTVGERVAVVGESGSGKSVTAYALLGLLDPAARVTSGRIEYRGRELLAATERERRQVRGRELAMIFQSPRAALSPVRTVGRHLTDVLARHHHLRGRAARARALELLARVQITDPARRLGAYSFELSGGMCQRVLIALALACEPSFLIADEPTTGLDVTTQASIVQLLGDLCAERGMALLFITHDLPLAATTADRLLVMHAGQVVEDASFTRLLARPRHPYTARLLAAVPAGVDRLDALAPIPGSLPDLRDPPACRYRHRCERCQPACDQPLKVTEADGHRFSCWNPLEEAAR
jgi:peptide/nickel transport system ATP-binding protein